jgi:hypothetical protein
MCFHHIKVDPSDAITYDQIICLTLSIISIPILDATNPETAILIFDYRQQSQNKNTR